MTKHDNSRNYVRNLLIVFACAIGLYCGSYLVLSLGGHYEPDTIGLAGVKWYGWRPLFFSNDYRLNKYIIIPYFPLWLLDTNYWHTGDKAHDGKYPIKEPKDIFVLYEKWK